MLPPGHAAVAYLLLSTYRHARSRRPPRPAAAVVVAFASQFPDLVDKPLAAAGVLAVGRSLAHSLVTTALLVALLAVALGPDRRWVLVPFTVGTVSHALADAAPGVIAGRSTPLGGEFLLWPLGVEFPRSSLTWVPGTDLLRAALSARPASWYVIGLAAAVFAYDALSWWDPGPGTRTA